VQSTNQNERALIFGMQTERRDVRDAPYLLTGMESVAHAAATSLGQDHILKIQRKVKNHHD